LAGAALTSTHNKKATAAHTNDLTRNTTR